MTIPSIDSGDHVHGLSQRIRSEISAQRRPEPHDQDLGRDPGVGPGPRPDLPRSRPTVAIGSAAKRRSPAPASQALSVLNQPKFQASLSANSAATLRHGTLLPFRRTRDQSNGPLLVIT